MQRGGGADLEDTFDLTHFYSNQGSELLLHHCHFAPTDPHLQIHASQPDILLRASLNSSTQPPNAWHSGKLLAGTRIFSTAATCYVNFAIISRSKWVAKKEKKCHNVSFKV